MKVLNRKQTLREIKIKQNTFNSNKTNKIPYRDWVYSFGIGKTKFIKKRSYDRH
jgi:hypothetical protein